MRVNGRETPINYDFRSALRVILAFEDESLTGFEKQSLLLSILFPKCPPDAMAAITAANLFLNGGKTADARQDMSGGMRLYSFSKDADFIYSAFRQTHGIDLQKAELHWWEFLALFMDLGADTMFCNLVSLRKRVKTGTASKEERQAAREMGELFDVPDVDTRTLDEKEREAEFLKLVQGH